MIIIFPGATLEYVEYYDKYIQYYALSHDANHMRHKSDHRE